MSRQSIDVYRAGRLWGGYDYRNQAWVSNGRYVNCGHPKSMNCGCYGRLHMGERTTRRPTIDDVQAAMRGCQMRDMTQDELRDLRDEHKDNPLFASQVIAQAAALLLRLRS